MHQASTLEQDVMPTKAEERIEEFRETAQKRFTAIMETGRTIPWSEAREHLLRHASGEKPGLPKFSDTAACMRTDP
jgi:hypothetical protein